MSKRDVGRSARHRSAIAGAVAALYALVLVNPGVAGTQDGGTDAVRLAIGKPVFWDGPVVEEGHVPAWWMCGTAGECYSYRFEVTGRRATQLRVAIDWPAKSDLFAIRLLNPAGRVVDTQESYGFLYSEEVFAFHPAPGTWTLEVRPQEVTDSAFRGRVRLDSKKGDLLRDHDPDDRLLPDARVHPPSEFGFVAPVPLFVVTPEARAGDVAPFSCLPEESLEQGAERCLRFSAGVQNVGPGPMELRFDVNTFTGVREMRQAVYKGDGSVVQQAAGTYVFHPTHAHFHYPDYTAHRLFAVTDEAAGTLVPAGEARKSGFCMIDEKIVSWTAFDNAPLAYTQEGSHACYAPDSPDQEVRMGIAPGWSDVYLWSRPEQYVDFAGNADGLYVIRSEVNSDRRLEELDYSNNVGYAYFRVTGDDVELLERGHGTDPWDPRKVAIPAGS